MRNYLTLKNAAIGASLLFLAAGLSTSTTAAAADRLADVPPVPGIPPLTVTGPNGTSVHLYPTVSLDARRKQALGPPSLANVTYHSGGRINTSMTIYAIFWKPPTLQTGAATSMPTSYINVLTHMMQNYAAHAIAWINTQYFQRVVIRGITVTQYHTGLGSFGGSFVDTAAYPASGCSDSFTPGNCLSDAQLRAEISKVMGIQGWTPGFNKIYVLFTSSGEGSCFNASSCAYTQYCAYHGFFGSASNPVIYSNEPFGNNSVCQVSGPLPNAGTADSAATAARHEISEATSDPLLNAWFDGVTGEETSDKCNFNYGTRTFDGGLANYQWGGFFFLLQQEYSNHSSNCTQANF